MSATTPESALRTAIQAVFDDTINQYYQSDRVAAQDAPRIAGLPLRNTAWKHLKAAGYLFTDHWDSHQATRVLDDKVWTVLKDQNLLSRIDDYFQAIALHPELQRFVLEDIRKTPVEVQQPLLKNVFFDLNGVPFVITGKDGQGQLVSDGPETYVFDATLANAIHENHLITFQMKRRSKIRALCPRHELGSAPQYRISVNIDVEMLFTYHLDPVSGRIKVNLTNLSIQGQDSFSKTVCESLRFTQDSNAQLAVKEQDDQSYLARLQSNQNRVCQAAHYASHPCTRYPKLYKAIIIALAVISVLTSVFGVGLFLGYWTYCWYQDRIKPRFQWKDLLQSEVVEDVPPPSSDKVAPDNAAPEADTSTKTAPESVSAPVVDVPLSPPSVDQVDEPVETAPEEVSVSAVTRSDSPEIFHSFSDLPSPAPEEEEEWADAVSEFDPSPFQPKSP